MNSIIAIAIKDLRLLWRDRMGLFWVLAFPLIYASFFGAIFSGGQAGSNRIGITVIDEDSTDGSRGFVKRLEASNALTVHGTDTKSSPARDREAARAAVLKGERVAYVVVKPGFGDSQGMFFGKSPPLEVGIDPSRKAEAGMLQGVLMEAAFKGMGEQFMDRDKMR